MADDLGWKDLHCYGNAQLDTPCLDRLAQEGMRFTNAYAASPVCSPTRAAMMTGLANNATSPRAILNWQSNWTKNSKSGCAKSMHAFPLGASLERYENDVGSFGSVHP